jgi:hypothetical protein
MVSGFMVLSGGAASTNPRNKKVRYVLIPIVIAAFALLALFTIREPSENIQYVGSPDGYQGFVPKGVINYEGHTNPRGDLILDDGRVLNNAIWHGKYSDTIAQDYNKIIQLNNYFVGKDNPINNQKYVDMQPFIVIKGQVPIKEITINGQTYYLIDANKINDANIAGFYTYKGWVNNFVAAMNIPGTYAAVLPGGSPVFKWQNLTGTVAYQTKIYGQYVRGFFGGPALVQPNGSIIPYGINANIPIGTYLLNFINPKQLYNPSS